MKTVFRQTLITLAPALVALCIVQAPANAGTRCYVTGAVSEVLATTVHAGFIVWGLSTIANETGDYCSCLHSDESHTRLWVDPSTAQGATIYNTVLAAALGGTPVFVVVDRTPEGEAEGNLHWRHPSNCQAVAVQIF